MFGRQAREDIDTLMAVIDWSRDKIETLIRMSEDEFTIRNLRAIAHALDLETSPKLRPVFGRHGRKGEHGQERTTTDTHPHP